MYHKGGSLADDQLTAQQVRARYSIPSNSKIKNADGVENSPLSGFFILSVSVAVVAMVVAYLMGFMNTSKSGAP